MNLIFVQIKPPTEPAGEFLLSAARLPVSSHTQKNRKLSKYGGRRPAGQRGGLAGRQVSSHTPRWISFQLIQMNS